MDSDIPPDLGSIRSGRASSRETRTATEQGALQEIGGDQLCVLVAGQGDGWSDSSLPAPAVEGDAGRAHRLTVARISAPFTCAMLTQANAEGEPASTLYPSLWSSPAIGVTCSPARPIWCTSSCGIHASTASVLSRTGSRREHTPLFWILQMEAPVAPADRAARLERRSAVLLKPFRPRTSHIVKLRSITVIHYDAYDFSAKG